MPIYGSTADMGSAFVSLQELVDEGMTLVGIRSTISVAVAGEGTAGLEPADDALASH